LAALARSAPDPPGFADDDGFRWSTEVSKARQQRKQPCASPPRRRSTSKPDIRGAQPIPRSPPTKYPQKPPKQPGRIKRVVEGNKHGIHTFSSPPDAPGLAAENVIPSTAQVALDDDDDVSALVSITGRIYHGVGFV